MRRVLLVVGLLPAPAFAQQTLTTDEIRAFVVGKEFLLPNQGIVEWTTDGTYKFLGLNGGGMARGKYAIADDKSCVEFGNGGKRCDEILKDGSKYYFKSRRGTYEMVPR